MAIYLERECFRHGVTKHRRENDERWRCVRCSTEYRKRNRQKNKFTLVQEFGGRCQRCGYDKSLRALQFHHPDPTIKDFGVAKNQSSMSLSRQREEAKKCELVCANCHAEIHDELEHCGIV